MARCATQIQKRNDAIKKTFTTLKKGRCAKWKTDEIVKELADIFFLKPKTVYNILSAD